MNKKRLIASLLTIVMCVSLIAGSTFALFTSKDTIDVSVEAAKVNIVATVENIQLYSMDVKMADDTFENGGTAKYDDETGIFTLTNVAPGDKVDFDIKVTNNSNITIQYRVKWDVSGELTDALVATVDGVELKNGVSEWSAWTTAEEATKTLALSLELPVDTDDTYQEKRTDVSFVVEAVQGNGTDLYGKTAVSDLAGLKAAAENADDTNIIALTQTLTIAEEVALDLNGKTLEGDLVLENGASLTLSNGNLVNDDKSVSALQINGENVTVVLDNVNIESARHALRVEGENADVTINGGTYKALGTAGMTTHALNVGGDNKTCTVTIKGGTFIGPKGTAADSGAALKVQAGANVIVEGGNFSNGLASTITSAGTLTIMGGTFDQDPTAYVAEGYEVKSLANGNFVVVVNGTAVVSGTDASNAINEGGKILLDGDVESSTAMSKDVSINLNGNTFEATSTLELKSNADLTMTGGNYEVNSTYGHVDVRPSTAEGSAVVFEDVDFSYNKLSKTYGPSTNRLGSVVEVCATAADAKTKIEFKNCTFDNASVLFEGMSGITGEIDATFENCTFNALTSSAPIEVQNYVKGKLTVKNCTFNLECTSSSASAISITENKSTTVELIAENNTINAKAATPYTYDAAKGETEEYNVKVNGTPANIEFASYGTNTTATVTGTAATGIAAIAAAE